MNDVIKHKIKHKAHRALVSVKWVIFAILIGGIVGLCGTAFYFCLTFVTVLRGQNPWLLYLLPVGGLIIVGAYHLLRDEKDTGTNLVISAIHSDDELPLRMAPLIFISTLITHLFGGSAGREGAALQMGGSIGNAIGKFFRFDDKDKHVMIMCGMSAAFSALFGTPMAAAILQSGFDLRNNDRHIRPPFLFSSGKKPAGCHADGCGLPALSSFYSVCCSVDSDCGCSVSSSVVVCEPFCSAMEMIAL